MAPTREKTDLFPELTTRELEVAVLAWRALGEDGKVRSSYSPATVAGFYFLCLHVLFCQIDAPPIRPWSLLPSQADHRMPSIPALGRSGYLIS